MVTSVTSTTDTSAASAAMKKSIGMNKDDFLKLFIEQLKNQDPLKPTDASQMLSQLSQLTQVEQAYNTNTNLTNLLAAQNSTNTMTSVSFIGKTVKANGNSASFDGASPTSLQFNLSVPTDSASVAITDAAGRAVRTVTLGTQAAGDGSLTWDGRNSSGDLLPAGAYNFTVTGTTAAGASIAATTYTAGRIDGVALVNGNPSLTIGAASVLLADVISIKGV
ncbi:MAG: flagellar hook capping protein [Desulfuromonadaceae bacterium GWB2_53_15]|nr:MAG: flagellar hook capping protein [Desulfuromonadales bacterium GWD2_54_10]OHB25268.1 MAG: flagellar hook capping protein [Desulfuromonadaceae bacterium GWB2_53_15]